MKRGLAGRENEREGLGSGDGREMGSLTEGK